MMCKCIKRGFCAFITAISLTIGATAITSNASAQTEVRYVDDNAATGGSGSSWATAYKHLQDALAAASQIVTTNIPPGVQVELRIAQGVYRPDLGNGYLPGTRSYSFVMVKRTRIIGGYAGPGEPHPDANDPSLYESRLTGEIGNAGSPTDNTYTVVKVSDQPYSKRSCTCGCSVGDRCPAVDGALFAECLGAGAVHAALPARSVTRRASDLHVASTQFSQSF